MVDGITDKKNDDFNWWVKTGKACVDVVAYAKEKSVLPKVKSELIVPALGTSLLGIAWKTNNNCLESRPITCETTQQFLIFSQVVFFCSLVYVMAIGLMYRYQGGRRIELRISQVELDTATLSERVDTLNSRVDTLDSKIVPSKQPIEDLKNQIAQLTQQGNNNSAAIQKLEDAKGILEKELIALKATQGRSWMPAFLSRSPAAIRV